jgi:hypothetical protein
VRADQALEEKNLFFEGGAGLLQLAMRDEAVRLRPHEDATAGGDVRPVEADGEAVLGLRFSSLLLRETCIYSDANIRDDLQVIGQARCGRDARWEKGGWAQGRALGQTRRCGG